ncbi:MAG: PAS domain-containing protein [Lentisphaerae bacterium]|nr:PAS domain-containing protein [Lentisphaerota bacterium]
MRIRAAENRRLFGMVFRRWTLVVLPLFLILASTAWALWHADRSRRSSLLLQARLIANSLHPGRVAHLASSPGDAASPDYLRLKHQLETIRQTDPRYHYLYLMGRQPDGEILFLVEAIPPDESEDPPGYSYSEASDELHRVFTDLQPFTEGPLQDEWGIWISAHVPVLDPESGTILALLGVDVDARNWHRDILVRAALPSILAAITILLGLTAILLLQGRRRLRGQQADLRESGIRFAQLAEQSRTLIWETDLQGLYTFVSPTAESVLGYPPEELVGIRHFYDLHPEDGRKEFMETTLRGMAEGLTFRNLENPAIARSGRTIWLSTIALPVRGPDGTVCRYRGSDMDITGRKQVEETLRKRNRYETQIADACALLLCNPRRQSRDDLIDAALSLLQKASGAHRVYVFENREDPVRGLCMSQTHEACAPGIRSQIRNPVLQALPYRDTAPRWQTEFSEGRHIQGRVADFPPEERPILEAQGIESILALPIRRNGAWSGFIGFDYVRHPRDWDEEDVTLLQTAADVIGGFLHTTALNATLQAERDRYERTVELLSDNVWTYEMDENRQRVDCYLSSSIDRMLQLPPGTIGNRFEAFAEYIHPDDLPPLLRELETADIHSPHGSHEYRVRDGRGNIRWFMSRGTVYRMPQNHLIIYGTTSDITDRKETEVALIKRNFYETKVAEACALLMRHTEPDKENRLIESALELLRMASLADRACLFENWQDPADGLCAGIACEVCADGDPSLCEHPPNLRLVYRNGFERWQDELPQGRCIQGHVSDFPPEEQQDLAARGIDSILLIPVHCAGEWHGFIEFDYRERPRDWDEEDITLLRTAAEVIGGFLHASGLRDILQAERDRYERTVELISDNVWIFETDARLRLVDSYLAPSIDRLLGAPSGTIDNDFEKFLSFIHPDDLPGFRKALRKGLIRRTAHLRLDYRVIDANGRPRWFHTRGSGYAKPDGNFIAYGTTSDITDRKKAEDELRESNLRLEKAVARANQLAREAREASQAKGRFLMQMSHEIRTPMNAVIGMADLLEESPLDPDQQNYLRILQSAGNHLLGVIDDILDYSKLESHSVQLQSRPFDLHRTAEKCAQLIAVKALEKALEIAFHVAPDVPRFVQGDELRLRQIIINLMGNAIKFTEAGSVSLLVERAGDDQIRLAVCDTGIGIPAEKIPLIFQRFYQMDHSMTRQYGGTGLGLAITREIIRLMNGDIDVESQPGKGSVFSVRLPFRPADPETIPEALRSDDSSFMPVRPAPSLPPLKILLVEDVEVNRDMIRFYLRHQPVELFEAVNGAVAVELCARQRFDAVLMDIEMPEMDGLTATRKIRENEILAGTPPVPVIALTAHALKEQADPCLSNYN